MRTKLSAILVLIAAMLIGIMRFTGSKTKTSYTTETATRGTLVVTVSASGNISSANSASVSTQTSGVVSKIFVKNGDTVKSGDPIAEVDLDMNGHQRASQALASYQSAKNQLASAQAAMFSLQSTMFSKWKTYTDIAENSTYQNPDGSVTATNVQINPLIRGPNGPSGASGASRN